MHRHHRHARAIATSGFPKNRDAAITLAARLLELRPRRNRMGCAKSAVCQWLRKAPMVVPQSPPDGTLELDDPRTRTRRGRTELKAIRAAATGTALGSFAPWAKVID